jgi:hypothetical protein
MRYSPPFGPGTQTIPPIKSSTSPQVRGALLWFHRPCKTKGFENECVLETTVPMLFRGLRWDPESDKYGGPRTDDD